MSDPPGTLIGRAGQREIRLLRKREMLDEIQGSAGLWKPTKKRQ